MYGSGIGGNVLFKRYNEKVYGSVYLGNADTTKRYMGVLYGKMELSKIEIEIENLNRILDFCVLKSLKCEPDMYGAERCMGVSERCMGVFF